MTEGLLEQYHGWVAAGELTADPQQIVVATALDALSRRLVAWRPVRKGLLSIFTRPNDGAPRGLYIHGSVGCGKTMLMDLFFETVDFTPKTRCHFHEFMADVHERLNAARHTVDGDPIPFVAREIALQSGLLCFDELQVLDIADAMILSRLFKRLFERGVVVIATSNAHPRSLYKDGLNRQLFLPFIDLIEDHMDVVELASAKDYRLEKLAGQPLYFTPADAHAAAELDKHWDRLTGGHPARAEALEVKGRKVNVPKASMGISRFDFRDLCELPLGPLDYLHIAHHYHTVLIDGIPLMTPEHRNEARRFINLIDTLYDNGICLIASAAAHPAELYPAGPGADAFERTSSRLMEMRSDAYLADKRRDRTPATE